jgi:thiol-disulfide isomerase/thioredoxin
MPSKSIMRSSSRSSKSSTSSNVMWVIIGLLVVVILLIVFMGGNRNFFEKFTNGQKPVLQYFYMDSCYHCKNFTNETWNNLESDIKSNPDKYKFSVAKYNLNDDGEARQLSEKYGGINSAPTLILAMADGTNWAEYKIGDRSKADLIRFVDEQLNK